MTREPDVANSQGYHEPFERLNAETTDRHRALASLQEELEAVDWYDQRIDAAHDDDLKAILAHNRDEEKEHAAMVLEWLRRRDPNLDRHLRTYLFSDGRDVVAMEEEAEDRDAAEPPPGDGSLGIGSLRSLP